MYACTHPSAGPSPVRCAQSKVAAIELGYQPDEMFLLKISQLRELFVVRWTVFLLGPAGCGKTAIWRTLMRTQVRALLRWEAGTGRGLRPCWREDACVVGRGEEGGGKELLVGPGPELVLLPLHALDLQPAHCVCSV